MEYSYAKGTPVGFIPKRMILALSAGEVISPHWAPSTMTPHAVGLCRLNRSVNGGKIAVIEFHV
jgi:hypothetical protein